jgi:hypothetical protein
MKLSALLVLLLAFLVLPVAQAQEAADLASPSTAVPVKGTIDASGSVALVITFYDRELGGHKLYSMPATLPVEKNTYFGMVDVPDTIFRDRKTVYVGVAKAAATGGDVSRAHFTRPVGPEGNADGKSFTLLGCSICYSCGGSYPVFSGAWVSAGLGAQERGGSCSGRVSSHIDFHPYLCCQTGTL